MNNKSLLQLKSEIVSCKDVTRLLDLEINLKHFINIFSYKLEEEYGYSEEEIKNIKNSISLAKSYLSIISWKLENIKLDVEIRKIDAISDNKKEIIGVFETGFETFFINHSTSKSLEKENSELKKQLNKLNLKFNSLQNCDHKTGTKQEIPFYETMQKEHIKEMKKLRKKIGKMAYRMIEYLDEKNDAE